MNVPVSNTSYYYGAVYCAWREARLPTEAEWEYAAVGTASTTFPWGDEFDGTATNFCDTNCGLEADSQWDDQYAFKAPVDAFHAGVSWAGVYNLSGNVAEWTSTWHIESNGQATYARIIKGSSYLGFAFRMAVWSRLPLLDYETNWETGFRCARSSDPRET